MTTNGITGAKRALLGLLLLLDLSGCFRRRDYNQENMEASHQQLRQVLAALQITAMEIKEPKETNGVNDLVERVADAYGFDFFRSEVDSNLWLQLNPDWNKWKAIDTSGPEIAIYCPIPFQNRITKMTHFIALDFRGNQTNLLEIPSWKGLPVRRAIIKE